MRTKKTHVMYPEPEALKHQLKRKFINMTELTCHTNTGARHVLKVELLHLVTEESRTKSR